MKKVFPVLTALFVCVCLLLTGCGTNDTIDSEFEAPASYAAVLQVTINPTVNLYLDENNVILAVEYVNADAKDTYKSVEQELVGADLQSGMDLVVQKAVDTGVLAEGKEVTINVLESKTEQSPNTVLKVANTAAKSALEKNELTVDVNTLAKGEAVSKEDLETDEDTTTTTVSTTTTAAATTTTKAPVTTTTKAPTTTASAKNPLTDLQLGKTYACYRMREDGMVDGLSLAFDDDGLCHYAQKLFTEEDFGQGEVIQFQGKTWYEGGGKGGAAEYTRTAETIEIDDGEILILTMSKNGDLVVKNAAITVADMDFKAGDVFALK